MLDQCLEVLRMEHETTAPVANQANHDLTPTFRAFQEPLSSFFRVPSSSS